MVYIELYTHLEKYTTSNGYSGTLVTAALNAITKLNKYYPSSDGLVYVIGTILDPRCKLALFTTNTTTFPKDLTKNYKSALKNTWKLYYKPNWRAVNAIGSEKGDSHSNEKKLDTQEDLFAIHLKKAKLDNRDELQLYLAQSIVPSSAMPGGPLE